MIKSKSKNKHVRRKRIREFLYILLNNSNWKSQRELVEERNKIFPKSEKYSKDYDKDYIKNVKDKEETLSLPKYKCEPNFDRFVFPLIKTNLIIERNFKYDNKEDKIKKGQKGDIPIKEYKLSQANISNLIKFIYDNNLILEFVFSEYSKIYEKNFRFLINEFLALISGELKNKYNSPLCSEWQWVLVFYKELFLLYLKDNAEFKNIFEGVKQDLVYKDPTGKNLELFKYYPSKMYGSFILFSYLIQRFVELKTEINGLFVEDEILELSKNMIKNKKLLQKVDNLKNKLLKENPNAVQKDFDNLLYSTSEISPNEMITLLNELKYYKKKKLDIYKDKLFQELFIHIGRMNHTFYLSQERICEWKEEEKKPELEMLKKESNYLLNKNKEKDNTLRKLYNADIEKLKEFINGNNEIIQKIDFIKVDNLKKLLKSCLELSNNTAERFIQRTELINEKDKTIRKLYLTIGRLNKKNLDVNFTP